MHVLIVNGSPKGTHSNSLRLADSFVSGYVKQAEKDGRAVTVDTLHLSSLRIAPCKGCFACWKSTPGVCCINDDMAGVLEKLNTADLVIWSFPLYYYGLPGPLKTMIDRQLPTNLPFMSSREDGYGSGSHESRHARKAQRHLLVSTCGFYSAEGNYDSVTSMFDHMLGKGGYETIFCGQGELFYVEELSARTDEYLAAVKTAGTEFACGSISASTRAALDGLLYPKDTFEAMADASWGVSKETGEREPEDLAFTRQMAALYNPASYDGRGRVLEMLYTDLGRTYQILLGRDGSEVRTDGSLTATTRIETPFTVWQSIAKGEISGEEALGRQLYRVTGDFSLMVDWNRVFGAAGNHTEPTESDESQRERRPSMAAMLVPWIVFWTAASIDPVAGTLASLVVTALVPVLFARSELVVWDRLSIAAVTALSVLTFASGDGNVWTVIGYLAFGLLWIGSCLIGEPLCATYVKYNYGGDKALNNPLFMRTNYILAIAWGALYVLTAAWTLALKAQGFSTAVLLANTLVPMAMGLFTAWFERCYPAWLAGRKTDHT